MEPSWNKVFIWGVLLLSLSVTHRTVFAANVAPRGIATQSAEPADAANSPDMAIDEYQTPTRKTCASVPVQDDPWWQLDLRSVYRITAVSIFSIGDCCQEQLNGAEIRIGLQNDTSNQMCAVVSVVEGKRIYNYDCGVRVGRFVHVVLPGQQKTLTVCEVQVFGNVLENLAIRGVAVQSSSRWRTAGSASNVVDGVQFTTCSITQNKPGQWVNVDLLAPYIVRVIQLAFSENCCYEVEVKVDDTECTPMGVYLSLLTVDCGGVVGRNVMVFHPDVPLTLCEVEVYSTLENALNIFPQRPTPPDYCSFDYCSRDYVVVYSEPKTWFEAQTYCREKFTDLASISSSGDMNKVINKMIESNMVNVWIGLYEDSPGSWKWSDGGESSFRSWQQGQPDSSAGGSNCASVNGGKWRAMSCDTKSMFLCYSYKKRFLVRMSTMFDLSDPVIQQQIPKQLEKQMKNKGIRDVKIRWRRTVTMTST